MHGNPGFGIATCEHAFVNDGSALQQNSIARHQAAARRNYYHVTGNQLARHHLTRFYYTAHTHIYVYNESLCRIQHHSYRMEPKNIRKNRGFLKICKYFCVKFCSLV